jgi:hypothetical protein
MDIEVGGQIQGISLGSFLQIVHMDKTTCTLKIYSNDDIGYLYMKDGALVAAETGHLANVDAAYEILSWNKTVIIIDNAPIPNQNIKVPLMSVLMEGLRRKDEKNAQMGVVEDAEPKELDIEFDPDTYQSKDDQIASQFVIGNSKEPAEPLQIDDSERTEKPLKMAEKPQVAPVMPPDLPLDAIPVEEGLEEEIGGPKPDGDTAFFEDEDLRSGKPAYSMATRIRRMGVAIAIAAAVIFGSLHLYGIFLGKSNYNRIIDQVKSQKDLESMKKALETYINSQDENNRYIADAISKMNDINDLIKVENSISALSLDDNYKEKAMGYYDGFLRERWGTFLEDYVKGKLIEIPKNLEAYEFKKLAVMEKLSRRDRMNAYKSFMAAYPESKNKQVVQNLIAALSDDSYAELTEASIACSKQNRWESCIRMCDSFIRDFSDDPRAQSVIESRKKMMDRLELQNMKSRAVAMDYDSAKKMFIDYLGSNIDSTVKNDIREQIATLNQKIELQAKWEETSSYCRNSQIDVYQRIRELKDYMDRDAPGMFKRDAEALMRDLKKEERVGQARMAEILREREENARYAKVQAERDRVLQERERIRSSESKRNAREQKLGEEARRMTRILGDSNGRFRVNSDKTVTDSRTGLVWCLVDSYSADDGCMDFDSAKDYVRSLNVGGYRDWRLPDTGELALLYNSKPYFPSSGASWYWTLRSSSDAWNDKAAVFYPDRKDVFEQVYKSKSDCGFVHAVRP